MPQSQDHAGLVVVTEASARSSGAQQQPCLLLCCTAWPQPCSECSPVTMQVGEGQQVQIVQAQPQGQSQQAQSGTGQTMQVMQQIITNTGEIQQIPVSHGGAGCELPAAASAWGCVCVCVCFLNWKRKFGLSVFPAPGEKTIQV